MVELRGEPFGMCAIKFNELNGILIFERLGEPLSYIAASPEHHPPDRFVHAPELSHDTADIFRGSNEEDLIPVLYYRSSARNYRRILPEDGCDPCLDVRHMTADFVELVANHGAARESTYRYQPDFAAREFQHLKCFGELDQLDNVITDDLFRTDSVIDAESIVREDLRMREVITCAYARDARWRIEELSRELACDKVGFIAARDSKYQIGVRSTGVRQYGRVCGVTDDGAQIEAILQRLKPRGVGINDSNVVRFRAQTCRYGAAHLPCTENNYFQAERLGREAAAKNGDFSPIGRVVKGVNTLWHNRSMRRAVSQYTRIHAPDARSVGAVISVPPAAAHHLLHVLRGRCGDVVTVFNEGTEFSACIVRIDKTGVSVKLTDAVVADRESPIECVLAQAISSGERMDITLQKAVELGICAVRPLYSERSIVRLDESRTVKRMAHWEQVIISACEQCGRNVVPDIVPPDALMNWLATLSQSGGDELRVLLSPGAPMRLADLARPATVTLLAGPEGGLTDVEQEAAISRGFIAVRLGPRVLRTETAALTALAAINTLWGDF